MQLKTLPKRAFAERKKVSKDLIVAQRSFLTQLRLIRQLAKLKSGAKLVRNKVLTSVSAMRVMTYPFDVTHDVGVWA